MALKVSVPIIRIDVKVSPDILGPIRTQGQLVIFSDKISVRFLVKDNTFRKFDLHNFYTQILPNLDTLMVIGTGCKDNLGVYVFFPTATSRDKCMASMRVLGFRFYDEFMHPLFQRRMTTSNSLPTMSTITE